MLKDEALATITQHALIERGDTILVALSGGADSVALLHVLHALVPTLGFSLCAAHLNHGIRGEEADEDQAFVQRVCDALGIALLTRNVDVPAAAAQQKQTLEQAARACRYAFLREAAQALGASKIALAHHMNDQAETLLLHLARGSGLTGLTGMRPQNQELIRPFLYCTRAQIEAYLAQESLPFRTDSTNLVAEYTRNKLRLDIIPAFEAHVNPAFVKSLCSAAELLLADETYLDGLARDALASAKTAKGYDRHALSALAYPLLSRAVRIALADAGAAQDIQRTHVQQVIALLNASTGARLNLPQADVWLDYDSVCFGRYVMPARADTPVPFCGEGVYTLPDGSFFTCSVSTPPAEGFKENRTVAYIDANKLHALEINGSALCFRSRVPGDLFFPVGAPGCKKLKSYLIDHKVSRGAREGAMLCAGSDVLFLPGFGISELVKLDASSASILRFEFQGMST